MKNLLQRALILDAITIPMMPVYWWLKGSHTVVQLSTCLIVGRGVFIIIGFLCMEEAGLRRVIITYNTHAR